MFGFRDISDSLLHLLFPHTCCGCGNDILSEDSVLCLRCLHSLPETAFAFRSGNPVEKIFRGRIAIEYATAHYYYNKDSLIQFLMQQFKYRQNRELGVQLGEIMGESLARAGDFAIDALVPLPLFPAKERKRGYNQAMLICEGIASRLHIPIINDAVCRPEHTETQTKKGRIERWKNMEGRFVLSNPEIIRDRHVLLIDDVITTGATLEACGLELLKAKNLRLSIATLCCAAQ